MSGKVEEVQNSTLPTTLRGAEQLVKENMRSCALCKKSYKHNFALKTHTCQSIEVNNES